MRVNPESALNRGVSMLVTFIALNVLYLVTCIPILTIGAATSALLEVTLRYADEERGNPLRDYVTALRRNALQATAVFLPFAAVLAMSGFAAAFWFSLDSTFSLAALIVTGIAGVYLFAAMIYALALVASFHNTTGRVIKNALLLPGADPVRTLGLVIIPVTGLALLVIYHPFAFLAVTIGFSLMAYLSALLLRSVFRRVAETSALQG